MIPDQSAAGEVSEHDPRVMREKHDGELARRRDVRVWLRLLSCSTVIEKRLRRRFEEQFETTLPRFDVLAMLERHGDGVTMTELSRALLVSNGNVTAVVRQLSAAGYVAVRPAPGDARSSIVSLTPEGRAHFDELAAAHHSWIGAMFERMEPQELDALYGLLAKLKLSVGAETGETL